MYKWAVSREVHLTGVEGMLEPLAGCKISTASFTGRMAPTLPPFEPSMPAPTAIMLSTIERKAASDHAI